MRLFMALHSPSYRGLRKMILYVIVAMLILIGIVSWWISPVRAAITVIGSVGVLFLPGFFLTFVLFSSSPSLRSLSQQGKVTTPRILQSLDWVERITLSFILSVVITSGMVFTLHWLDIMGPRNLAFAMALVNGVAALMALRFPKV